ncbi:MAG: DNA repair protein RadC [Rikenellaceae bacterium]
MLSLHDKIAVRGVESLSDAELLAVLLGGDKAISLAEAILENYGGKLLAVAQEELSRLRMVEGMGLKNAVQIKVAAEWGRRATVKESDNAQTISSSADVVDIFRPYFHSMKYEECWVLFLSTSNRIVERYRVSQGGVAATVVDHRLIIKRALELLSTQIIMVHNHPSGAVDPSVEDIHLTRKVKEAAALFDIVLIDHIIIADSNYYSFLSHNIL